MTGERTSSFSRARTWPPIAPRAAAFKIDDHEPSSGLSDMALSLPGATLAPLVAEDSRPQHGPGPGRYGGRPCLCCPSLLAFLGFLRGWTARSDWLSMPRSGPCDARVAPSCPIVVNPACLDILILMSSSSRWVAKLCRSACSGKFFLIPLRRLSRGQAAQLAASPWFAGLTAGKQQRSSSVTPVSHALGRTFHHCRNR